MDLYGNNGKGWSIYSIFKSTYFLSKDFNNGMRSPWAIILVQWFCSLFLSFFANSSMCLYAKLHWLISLYYVYDTFTNNTQNRSHSCTVKLTLQ